MANIANPGDVVTFADSAAVTQAGIVIGLPDTTHAVVAYDFMVTAGAVPAHAKEFNTVTVHVVSSDVD